MTCRGKTSSVSPCRRLAPRCLLLHPSRVGAVPCVTSVSSGRAHHHLACRSRLADVELVKLLRGLHRRRHRVLGPRTCVPPGKAVAMALHGCAADTRDKKKHKTPHCGACLKRGESGHAPTLSLYLSQDIHITSPENEDGGNKFEEMRS